MGSCMLLSARPCAKSDVFYSFQWKGSWGPSTHCHGTMKFSNASNYEHLLSHYHEPGILLFKKNDWDVCVGSQRTCDLIMAKATSSNNSVWHLPCCKYVKGQWVKRVTLSLDLQYLILDTVCWVNEWLLHLLTYLCPDTQEEPCQN